MADLSASTEKWVTNLAYRELPFRKHPADMAIYIKLLRRLMPRTFIEFGSDGGGSALWVADLMVNLGIRDPHVYSFDNSPAKEPIDPCVTFGFCDFSAPIDRVGFPNLPKPLLVHINASGNNINTSILLPFVHKFTARGDCLVIDQGSEDSTEEFSILNTGCYEIDPDLPYSSGKGNSSTLSAYLRKN